MNKKLKLISKLITKVVPIMNWSLTLANKVLTIKGIGLRPV